MRRKKIANKIVSILMAGLMLVSTPMSVLATDVEATSVTQQIEVQTEAETDAISEADSSLTEDSTEADIEDEEILAEEEASSDETIEPYSEPEEVILGDEEETEYLDGEDLIAAQDGESTDAAVTAEKIHITDDLSNDVVAESTTLKLRNRPAVSGQNVAPETATIYKASIDKIASEFKFSVEGKSGLFLSNMIYDYCPALTNAIGFNWLSYFLISDGTQSGQNQLVKYFGEEVLQYLEDPSHMVYYGEFADRNGTIYSGNGTGILLEMTAHHFSAEDEAGEPVIKTDVSTSPVEYTLPQADSTTFSVDTCLQRDKNGNLMGDQTWEWYKNTENSYKGAELLKAGQDGQMAVKEYLSADLVTSSWTANATSVVGTTYYFCKVTNTLSNGKSASAYSSIASVTVKAPEKESVGIITGEEAVGTIYVQAEDSVPVRTDMTDQMGNPVEDPGPTGELFNYTKNGIWVYPSDTMTTVIARAALLAGVEIGISGTPGSGMGSYIYKLGDREEFDRGKYSGWMGSLNGWYTNTGFDNYKISDGTLQPGDYIHLKYTTDLGKDIGATFDETENSTRLKSLTVLPMRKSKVEKSSDFLSEEFDPDVHEYEISYHPVSGYNNWDNMLQVTPVAENQQNKVRVFVGDQEYRGFYRIPITEKVTVITIKIENPSAEEEPTGEYTITVYKDSQLLKDGSVTLKETAQDEHSNMPKVYYSEAKRSELCNLFSADLQIDTADESYRTRDLTVTLNHLPDGVTAVLKRGGNSWAFTDGSVTVKDGVLFVGTRTYTIQLTTEDGTRESYYLQLKKQDVRMEKYSFIPMFGTSEAAYTEDFNGEEEGTWFQLDEDGKENGKTGFNRQVTDYRIYVGSFVDGISFDVKSADFGTYFSGWHTCLSVNDELIYDSQKTVNWATMYTRMESAGILPLKLTEGENKITLLLSRESNERINRTYTLYIVKKNATVADIEAGIMALPDLEDLSYSKDKGTVDSLKMLYENLDEETKKEISAEAVAKLEASVKHIEELYESGINAISTLKDLIDSYADKVTEENYKDYTEAVLESKEQYDALSGWVYEQFMAECKTQYNAMNTALEAVRRGKIAANETNGEPTDYIDDFMVSANAFNLILGAEEEAYPVNFKDFIASNPRRNEACLPYNTPNRLKFNIEDESIFRISSKITSYEDKGFGGGGTYDNELYYMVPLKEGTTTFTVTLTDETGTYYGQSPKMIVHVNSAEEAFVEDLENKLTNIYSLPYTTKYDTWYYWKGTKGAEFSFHVNGTDAKVAVLDYYGAGKQNIR